MTGLAALALNHRLAVKMGSNAAYLLKTRNGWDFVDRAAYLYAVAAAHHYHTIMMWRIRNEERLGDLSRILA